MLILLFLFSTMASNLFSMDQENLLKPNSPLTQNTDYQPDQKRTTLHPDKIKNIWELTEGSSFLKEGCQEKVIALFSTDPDNIKYIKNVIGEESFIKWLRSFLFKPSKIAQLFINNHHILSDKALREEMVYQLNQPWKYKISFGCFASDDYHNMGLDKRSLLFDKETIETLFESACDKRLTAVQANILINALRQKEVLYALSKSPSEWSNIAIVQKILKKRDKSKYNVLFQRCLIEEILKEIEGAKGLFINDTYINNLIKEWVDDSLNAVLPNGFLSPHTLLPSSEDMCERELFEHIKSLWELKNFKSLWETDFIKEIYPKVISCPHYNNEVRHVMQSIMAKRDFFEIFTPGKIVDELDDLYKELDYHSKKTNQFEKRDQYPYLLYLKFSDAIQALFTRKCLPPVLKKWLKRFIFEVESNENKIKSIHKALLDLSEENFKEIIDPKTLIQSLSSEKALFNLLKKHESLGCVIDKILPVYTKYNIHFNDVPEHDKLELNQYLCTAPQNRDLFESAATQILSFPQIMKVVTQETLVHLWGGANNLIFLHTIRDVARANSINLLPRNDLDIEGLFAYRPEESIMNVDTDYFNTMAKDWLEKENSQIKTIDYLNQHVESYSDNEAMRIELKKQLQRLNSDQLNIIISKIERGYTKQSIKERWKKFLTVFHFVVASNGDIHEPKQSCSPDRWAIYALNELDPDAFWYTELARLSVQSLGENERARYAHIFDMARQIYKNPDFDKTYQGNFKKIYYDFVDQNVKAQFINNEIAYVEDLEKRLGEHLQKSLALKPPVTQTAYPSRQQEQTAEERAQQLFYIELGKVNTRERIWNIEEIGGSIKAQMSEDFPGQANAPSLMKATIYLDKLLNDEDKKRNGTSEQIMVIEPTEDTQ